MLGYRVPAPDEAMLISGGKIKSKDITKDGAPFRVVTGHGAFVMPWFRKVRFLSLAMLESVVDEPCVTKQGIAVKVRAVIAFKVGSDHESIVGAGQRFLSDQNQMAELTGRIFAGHLRSIVGGLTVEEIVRERQRLATEVLDGSKEEMARIGLVVDALQIQELGGDQGTAYIQAMAAPHNAAIRRDAEIAQAEASRASVEAQQVSERKQAEYERETQMLKAQYKADTDKAEAIAAQAGPLANADAQQQVLAKQSGLAQRQADLRQQQLVAEVQRPAEAEAKRMTIMAEGEAAKAEAAAKQMKINSEAEAARQKVLADANATAIRLNAEANAAQVQATGLAEAETIRAKGLAQAEGDLAKANAVAAHNGAQIDLARVNVMPEVAQALAGAFSGANLTMLDGADGISKVMATLLQQGQMIYNTFKNTSDSTPHTNGQVIVEKEAASQ